ncbi:hypothetical protein ACLQ2H_09765 [Streptomyces globisporus]|uniref:hypothetical protein n=1 Tax=Streptomyces globisporus TaxID=1908 RepID=UPI003CF49364
MTYEDGEGVPSQTLAPYPAGILWTFTGRTGRTQTVELVLSPAPAFSSIGDEYTPAEVSAESLWGQWVKEVAYRFHKEQPDQYRPGEVPIEWSVALPGARQIFDAAPHRPTWRTTPGLDRASDMYEREMFLAHYSHPVNAETEERLNWLRLPVMDLGWNANANHKGGFIQHATGWKPSPLQPTMDVRQIGAAAGLYVPPE